MSQNYILFYSRTSEKSFEILDILRKSESASRHILKANMEDPTIQIPPFIRNMQSPILLIHTGNRQRPEIHQGDECKQAILHLINKLTFFPAHQQKNAQSVMPPQPTGSIPRQSGNAGAMPNMGMTINGNGGGAGAAPNGMATAAAAGGNVGLNSEALGSLGMYESTNQLSNNYTLINDSNFVENHDHQYSYLDNPNPQQQSSGGGGGGQQSQQQKSQFDREYERMMQQRNMGIPKPLERR